MLSAAEYKAAWEKAREEYLRTGRRPVRVYTTAVPVIVKAAARQLLAAEPNVEAQVVLRRLAHDTKVSAAVIRRADEHCRTDATIAAWLDLALAGLPRRGRKSEQPAPEQPVPAPVPEPEEKAIRRVRTIEGMRQFNLPMGAIITRDPDEPAPIVDLRYTPDALPPAGSPADKTGDTEKAKALVKSVEQRIAEGVDPAEAAKAYKKELHAARLRVQRARRKAEAAAAKAVEEDQKLDAGTTTKDATSSEMLAAAANGELWKYAANPGDKAKALYGAKAFDYLIGPPAENGSYSSAQMDQFAKLKGPGFIPYGGRFYEALQHDTEDGEYLPVMDVSVGDPDYTVKHGWAVRKNGMTILVEEAAPADDGGPSDATKQRIAAAAAAYHKVLSGVPEELRVLQRGVALLNGPNPKDAHWAKTYKMPGFQSFATGGRGGTYFWAGNETKLTTVAHEFGHNIDSQLHQTFSWVSTADGPVIPGQQMSWSAAATADQSTSSFFGAQVASDPKWFTATRAGEGHPITFGSHGVTSYGEKHVKEDFAESVRLYMKDRREGKIGYLKPEAGQSLGTNIRFADVWPERAAILDACFKLETNFDTAFRQQQREKLKTWLEAKNESAFPPAVNLAASYGLPVSTVNDVIVEVKQKAAKQKQYDQLVTDAAFAMKAGNMPPDFDMDVDKINYMIGFAGGQNDLLTDEDNLAAYDAAAAVFAEWQEQYDETKKAVLETHLSAIEAGHHYTYTTDAQLWQDAGFLKLNNKDKTELSSVVVEAAKKKAVKVWTESLVDLLVQKNDASDSSMSNEEVLTAATEAADSSQFWDTWYIEEDEKDEIVQAGVGLFLAKKQAEEAAALTEEQKAAKAAADAETLKAQAEAMSIEDLPKDIAQKIRKRKAFVKYKAKQAQKVSADAKTVLGFNTATNLGQYSTSDHGGDADAARAASVKKLNDTFAGKMVKFKPAPGSSWMVPKDEVEVIGFAVEDTNYGMGIAIRMTYIGPNGDEASVRARYLKSGTYSAPGVSEAEAQKLADEYERKAVVEAALEQLTGVAGVNLEDPTGTKLRPFKEGTRRKGASWLKKAGQAVDPLVPATPGVGGGAYYGDAENAKRNLAVQIAERLNTVEHWGVFRAYAKDYGIGTGHTGSRSKQELKEFDAYTPEERRALLYGEIAFRVRRWAGTSGDSQVGPLMMQKAAADEFGLEADYKARLLASSSAYDKTHAPKIIEGVEKVYAERTGAWFRRVLRAMYDHTQEQFAAEGITHVSLYRGMGIPTGQTWNIGDTVERAELQPINSWSTSKAIANRFKPGGSGRMLAAEVPVSRIIGSARTGFGCLNEYEFVVLDTDGPVTILE